MSSSGKPIHIWMVRAGNNNELAKTAEQKSAVAIGWSEMGDMTSLKSREDFKERYVQSYPDHSAPRVGVNTGQVYYFFRGMEFGKPRIKVQVKHRTSPVGGPEMRNFLATLDRDENGLFVSTGGFSSDARVEADKSRSTVTLLDRDGFIELMLEHYENLDPEFQAAVPLREIWVPTK